jgi:hypothetical protein
MPFIERECRRPSDQRGRVASSLSLWHGDDTAESREVDPPRAGPDGMAKDPDMTDRLLLDVHQKVKILGAPLQAEVGHSERIRQPAEQALVLRL